MNKLILALLAATLIVVACGGNTIVPRDATDEQIEQLREEIRILKAQNKQRPANDQSGDDEQKEEKPAAAPVKEQPPQVPLEQLFADPPPPVVAVMPTKVGSIGDPDIIVGFQDEDPCSDNSFERARLGISTVQHRNLFGSCLRVYDSTSRRKQGPWAWFTLQVNTMETVAHFAQGRPASMCVVDGDQLPIAMPGSRMDYLIPDGTHEFTIVLYKRAAVGPCVKKVGEKTFTRTFPYRKVRLPVDLRTVANIAMRR